MLRFRNSLGVEAADIDSINQDFTERIRSLLIKLKGDALVQDIVGRTFEANFKYESGLTVKVQLSEANGNLKYVRILSQKKKKTNTLKQFCKKFHPLSMWIFLLVCVSHI